MPVGANNCKSSGRLRARELVTTKGRDYFGAYHAVTPLTATAAPHKNTKRGGWLCNLQHRRRPPRGRAHVNSEESRPPAAERFAAAASCTAVPSSPDKPDWRFDRQTAHRPKLPTLLSLHSNATMSTGATRHGPPPSHKWEGIAQDERPPGETLNESPLRRERPYNHSRGNPASMALERLPPTCVAGRGDDVRRKNANARMRKGERSSRTTTHDARE